MEYYHVDLKMVKTSDMIGINIRNISCRDITSGMIISEAGSDCHRLTKSFTALIKIVYHPKSIKAGYRPIVYGMLSRT